MSDIKKLDHNVTPVDFGESLENVLTEAISSLEIALTERRAIQYGENLEGKIFNINEKKGFGFIISEARPFVKFFFHWTGCSSETTDFRKLRRGDIVSFTEAKTDRGWRAVHVKSLESGE